MKLGLYLLWWFTTAHSVDLTWKDVNNPAGATTYNVYKVSGQCTPGVVFGTPLNAVGVSGMAYTDENVTPGVYCYTVRAVVSGMESDDSNLGVGAVKPFAVDLTVVVR